MTTREGRDVEAPAGNPGDDEQDAFEVEEDGVAAEPAAVIETEDPDASESDDADVESDESETGAEIEIEPVAEPDWSAVERQAEPAEALALASAPIPLAGAWGVDPSVYEERWTAIQIGFVDEPHQSVARADQLVAQVVEAITAAITQEREYIAAVWRQPGDVSTEDLRQAFQRYRSLFDDLVSRSG